MRKLTLLLCLCCITATQSLFAQDRLEVEDYSIAFINELASVNNTIEADWSFYEDEENKLYLIDLETIPHNIQDIVVLNSYNKEIIWEESVFDLPVNSIYELDYSKYPKGKYQIELRSISGILKKEIEIE